MTPSSLSRSVVATDEGVDSLVNADGSRVNQRVYVDPAIHALELDELFHGGWVYVGHESEVPSVGDFRTTYIGRVPVILVRSDDDVVRVLVNRCAHRGTTVCQLERGHASSFDCDYHGWVYDTRGRLTGVTLRGGYASEELTDLPPGLDQAARVGTYSGFVFASLRGDVPDLEDHLGAARPYLDDWAAQSPTGAVVVTNDVWRHRYGGNWKIGLEGSTEGYHPDFLHKVAFRAQQRRRKDRSKDAAVYKVSPQPSNAIDLGHGHGLVEMPHLSAAARRSYPASYLEQLEAGVGPERLDAVLGPPWRLHIFPNVAIAGSNIRTFRPLAVDRTEVRQWFVSIADAPSDVHRFRVSQEQGFYGPAGFGGPDDLEIFERIQEGYGAAVDGLNPWVRFNRQASSETVASDGTRVAHSTSEIQERAIYRAWRARMGPLLAAGGPKKG